MDIPNWIKKQYDKGTHLMDLADWLYWDEFIKFVEEEKINVNIIEKWKDKEKCKLLLRCWIKAIDISSDN